MKFKEIEAETDASCLILSGAAVIGNVKLKASCSVWFNATIRGDVQPILIGESSNVQDNTVIHGSTGGQPVRIGDRVTIGHSCIVHGCTIENDVLVGMGSVILDDVVIEPNVIVGAKSLITKGTRLKSGFVYAGHPAKVIRPCTDKDLEYIQSAWRHYVEMIPFYK
jgi:carbonic anhydrase/acetyltransferase-like protein (isoleucine patch superfamily)